MSTAYYLYGTSSFFAALQERTLVDHGVVVTQKSDSAFTGEEVYYRL